MHPVNKLKMKMDELFPRGYRFPDGVVGIKGYREEGINEFFLPWTGFFPGNAGVWQGRPPREQQTPFEDVTVRRNKIMILAHNWHCEKVYTNCVKRGVGNLTDVTWIGLFKIMKAVGICPKDCFFTNFFVGLREGDKPEGIFSTNLPFVQRCRDFFHFQLQTIQPKLVIVLGRYIPPLVAPIAPQQLIKWAKMETFPKLDQDRGSLVAHINIPGIENELTFVAIVHRCRHHLNVPHRRYYPNEGGELRGCAAEEALLGEAMESAKYKPHACVDSCCKISERKL